MSDKRKQNEPLVFFSNIKPFFPLKYCCECGTQINNEELHYTCIKWGLMLKKYKTTTDWHVACLENGKRVANVLKIEIPLNTNM